jgi:NAD(P)-dependent dehydrogenase (short-subunit alcohol dehydrogenase family)
MSDSTGSILITGANGGLGSAIATQIATSPDLRDYHGIYTVRNAASSPALDAALQGSGTPDGTSASAHTFEKISLDLSHLDDVRKVALDIKSRIESGQIPPIRALVLNAGVEEFTTQTWTDEGLDKTFATNYLAHWLLTMMLLGSMDRERGRVIWITSWSHKYVDPHMACRLQC